MFCLKCGKEVSGKFCGGCGAEVDKALPFQVTEPVAQQPVGETFVPPSPSKPSANPGDPKWVIGKLRSLKRGPAIGLGVAIAIVVVSLVALSLGGNATGNTSVSTSGTAFAKTSPPAVSPHKICTIQVYAMAAHMLDQTSGINAEMIVNGYSDPFFSPAEDVWRQMITDKYSKGMAATIENAKVNAGTVCSNTLNDAIRPNYPTDGTYPDTGSSDSGGGGGVAVEPPCAVGTQIRGSDGVCRD